MMEQIIVLAVNKCSNLKNIVFHDLDEITDVLDYDEILSCILRYYYSLGVPKENFSVIKDYIEKFYTMIPKTIDEVLN